MLINPDFNCFGFDLKNSQFWLSKKQNSEFGLSLGSKVQNRFVTFVLHGFIGTRKTGQRNKNEKEKSDK